MNITRIIVEHILSRLQLDGERVIDKNPPRGFKSINQTSFLTVSVEVE